MRQDGEPSVEEILESIKKVIARDNRDGAVAERRQRETDGMADDDDGDEDRDPEILELSEEVTVDDDDDAAVAQEPLVAQSVRQSMQESFAALALLSEPGAQPQIVRSGETSLEGIVREALRPMLSAWLDKNLPPMVEQMVAAEIARITGKRS